MGFEEAGGEAKVLAYSPGRYPILIARMPSGELRALYHEAGYDPERSKPVTAEWLRENALGRHGFVEVDPPREVPLPKLEDYVRRELMGWA